MKILFISIIIVLFCSSATAENPNAPIPYLGEISSALCAMFWAFSTILFRVSGDQIGPMSLNLFKNVLAFFLFVITLVILNIGILPSSLETPFFPDHVTIGDWLILILSGYIGLGIADTLYFAGLNRIGAGYSAIIDCSYSLFMVMGSYFYLNEPLSPKVFIALFLIIVAISISTYNPQTKVGMRPISRTDFYYGAIFGTLAMFFVAFAIILANPVLKKTDPIWANTVRMIGGIIPLIFLGFAPWYRKIMYECFTKPTAMKAAIPACLLGNYLAMIAWFLGMKYAYASTAGVLNQLSTIFILFFAAIFLRESITWRKLIAMIMGFSGGVIIAL